MSEEKLLQTVQDRQRSVCNTAACRNPAAEDSPPWVANCPSMISFLLGLSCSDTMWFMWKPSLPSGSLEFQYVPGKGGLSDQPPTKAWDAEPLLSFPGREHVMFVVPTHCWKKEAHPVWLWWGEHRSVVASSGFLLTSPGKTSCCTHRRRKLKKVHLC